MNPIFISNIKSIYGDIGERWIQSLPKVLNKLSEKWDLRVLDAMPNLTYNFICLAEKRSSGETLIIKMGPQNLAKENAWFNSVKCGVPKIFAYDQELNALLMERIVPGHSLKNYFKDGKDDEATLVICQTIRKLQSHQLKKSDFKHVSDFAKTLHLLKGHLDNKLLSKAISLYHELTADPSTDVILHGDLHHDNILSNGSEWLVIDPHGYVGDPVFEVGPMIFNPCDDLLNHPSISKIIERRLKILKEELPFDPKRIKAWAFCRTILSLAWSLEDHGSLPPFEVLIAAEIDKIRI